MVSCLNSCFYEYKHWKRFIYILIFFSNDEFFYLEVLRRDLIQGILQVQSARKPEVIKLKETWKLLFTEECYVLKWSERFQEFGQKTTAKM